MNDLVYEADSRIRLVMGGSAFGYPVSALRTEQRKGRLVVLRVAGKDYVNLEAIREMERPCTIKVDQQERR